MLEIRLPSEMIEDMEDICLALERLENSQKTWSQQDLEDNLDDEVVNNCYNR